MSGIQSSKAKQTLSAIVFPGGFNWPLFVAQEKGLFDEVGLVVTLTPTPNSVFQMTSLIRGVFDVAMTAFDNVVAYNDAQTDSKEAIAADLVAVSGGDRGFLTLTAAKGISDVAALRGKRVAVDALTTGYAFVLLEVLARSGLDRNSVEFVKCGGVADRYKGLLEGQFDATLLVTPFDIMAGQSGFCRLATGPSLPGPYQGVVCATNRGWAKRNGENLTRFIRAQISAVRWLYEPRNRADAIDILRKHVPQMSQELANQSYAVMVDALRGFQPDAAVDMDGLNTVLSLRAMHSGMPLQSADPGRHVDLSYYQNARLSTGTK